MKQKNSGVTLIALIITIIVLLILAGVTIVMIMGDNGILNQAMNAADETNRANVQSELELAVSSVITEWSDEKYVNSNEISLEDYMTKSKVEENMDTNTYVLNYFKVNREKGAIITYNNKIYLFTVEITSNGSGANVIYEGEGTESDIPVIQNAVDAITSENYGNFVDYSVNLNEDEYTTNDWRIFYNNGERVFIIAADYLDVNSSYLASTIPTSGIETYSKYIIRWYNVPAMQAINQSTLDLFMQSWTDYNTNINGKCVSTLLNTDNWVGLVDKRYADYAIGSPTLEMWIESYNSNGYSPLYQANNTLGYYVGSEENPSTELIAIYNLESNGYDNDLYFPYQTSQEDYCAGYWIASPSASGNNKIMYVSCGGGIASLANNSMIMTLRPVVALDENTMVEYDETNDVWILSN